MAFVSQKNSCRRLQLFGAIREESKRDRCKLVSPALFQGNENHTAQEGDRGCETNEDGQQAVISERGSIGRDFAGNGAGRIQIESNHHDGYDTKCNTQHGQNDAHSLFAH